MSNLRYKEDIFSPTLEFGGASVGITYLARSGNYVVIGDMVHFNISIELSNNGSSTGAATITGLPFPISPSAGGSSSVEIFAVAASGLTFTGQVNARLGGAAPSTIVLESFASGGSRTSLTNAAFNANTFVQISGSYITS